MKSERNLYAIIAFIMLMSIVLIFVEGCSKQPPTNGKLQAIDCLEEQRNVEACIEIYQPVCGQVQIQCITTPCNPIKETFENSCKACTNPNVMSYTMGECETDDNIKR